MPFFCKNCVWLVQKNYWNRIEHCQDIRKRIFLYLVVLKSHTIRKRYYKMKIPSFYFRTRIQPNKVHTSPSENNWTRVMAELVLNNNGHYYPLSADKL